MVNYKVLKFMKENNITTNSLKQKGVSPSTIQSIRENKNITINSLDEIHKILSEATNHDIEIGELIEFKNLNLNK